MVGRWGVGEADGAWVAAVSAALEAEEEELEEEEEEEEEVRLAPSSHISSYTSALGNILKTHIFFVY